MHFDVATLLAIHGLNSLALELLLVMFWCSHRRVAGLGLWTAANGLIGLASLAAAFRNHLPVVVGSLICNLVLFAGMLLLWNGVRRFNDRTAAWRPTAVAFVVFAALVTDVIMLRENYGARVIVTSAAYAGVLYLVAEELIRRCHPGVRRIAWTAAALFLVQATGFGLRIWQELRSPSDGDLLGGTSALTPGFLLVTIIMNVLMVCCLVMLAAQRLQAELTVAMERAERASRGKSEFLAMMSHELRTPLNAILGFSDVMRQQLFGPLGARRYQTYAEDIHTSGTHLLDLISTLLDVSKAEAGKLEVRPEWLDPQRIGRAVVRLVSEAAGKKGVKLVCQLPESGSRCWADERALKQILLNLLSNAVKFTPGGGKVTLEICPIDDGALNINVADTGIGISPDEIPRLLKPFEQVSNAYSAAQGGTGLGLPMVDALVRLHAGRLDIRSMPGHGTQVAVWLPPAALQPSAVAA